MGQCLERSVERGMMFIASSALGGLPISCVEWKSMRTGKAACRVQAREIKYRVPLVMLLPCDESTTDKGLLWMC